MKKTEIQNLIKELIEKTAITVSEISVNEEDSKHTWFSVQVSEPHFFTGKEGEALRALNHLVKKIAENQMLLERATEENETGAEFTIDIDGCQRKRVEAVKTLAHMMAERARYFKANVEVDPMSAFERRIVHEFLADATDIKTESEGTGRFRRVVIKYVGGI